MRINAIVLTIAPICLFVLYTNDLRGQEWVTIQVDTAAEQPAIAVDSLGRVHIAYSAQPPDVQPPPPRRVKHAVLEGGAFVITEVDSGQINTFVSLSLDAGSYPHLTYHSHENWGMRHTSWDGFQWSTEVIDHLPQGEEGGHEGWSSSLIFDYNNNGHISHIDFPSGGVGASQGLIYISHDGVDWSTEVIGTNSLWVFDGTSIGVNKQNAPYIAFYDSTTHNLVLADKATGTWALTEIDTADDVGQFPSMKFDKDDLPRIGYVKRLDRLTAIVRLAIFDGAEWMIQDIDTMDNIPTGEGNYSQHMIALEISSSGENAIAYSDKQNLFYATVGESTIEKELIADYSESDSVLEGNVWMDLDMNDVPHIAYSVIAATPGTPTNFYATRSTVEQEMCSDIDIWQGRCIDGGTFQFRVRMTDNASAYQGEVLEFLVDGTDSYFVPWIASGERGQATQIIFDMPGFHTVELVYPSCGFEILALDCDTLSTEADPWDDDFMEVVDRLGIKADEPQKTRLLGNYPNPFNPSTSISYSLGTEGWVTLKIYNTLGQEVATLIDQQQRAGHHSVVWNGRNSTGSSVAGGIYLYRIKTGNFVQTRKLLLLR